MANYGGSDHRYSLKAVATVDVFTPAIKNDVKHVETRTVHFSIPKSSFRFESDYSYCIGKFYHLFPPGISPDVAFIPSIIKSVQRWRIS